MVYRWPFRRERRCCLLVDKLDRPDRKTDRLLTKDDVLGGTAVVAEFERLTGCAVLVNTSFNVRGEPIVCTPEQAYTCFMRTEMDCLVMGDFLLDKRDIGEALFTDDAAAWQEEFQLD